MSGSVDEKVVSLKFDNSDFEQKADKSISSLEKLNKSIDFSNHQKGGKGLEALSQTIKSNDLGAMEKSVGVIAQRFSNLGIVGVTALQNITNKAVNAGERLLKSLTIDPIKSGLNEYELKIGSMRTILASTRNEFKSEGEAINKVNGYLNELNKYSDDTIYSFSDMTNNIGKFTNAGVKLEVAVQAIKGISNEAAISGANAQEASRAMYNFSQALSAGYVKLIDWKSIENANMATKEFKEQLIETAVATGDLTKKGDVYLTSKGREITATKNFNDSLQDQWMTTKVLTTTLNNYATDVERLGPKEKKAYEEKLKAIGYTDEQIKKIEETGTKAYQAAAEVTTWSKLVDTLQEAVQSGWAQTFELLFGNIKEATNLWTGLNKVISGFVDATSNARNDLLQDWKEAGGRTAMLNGLANVLKYIGKILKPIGVAFREVFPPASGKSLADASKRFEELTKTLKPSKAMLNNIRDAFVGLFSVIKLAKNTFFGLVKAIIPAGSAGGSLFKTFFALAGAIGRVISSIVVLIDKSGVIKWLLSGIEGAVKIVTNILSGLAKTIEDVLTPVAEKMSTKGDGNPFSNLADGLTKLGNSSSNIDKLTGPLNGFKKAIKDISEGGFFSKIEKGFSDTFGSIEAGGWSTVLFQILKVLGLAGLVKAAVKKFGKDSLLDVIKKPFSASAGAIDSIKDAFTSLGGAFTEVSRTIKAARKNIQYQSFKIIATSILMLATSVYLLSRISVPDMKKALIALTYISAVFVAVAKIASSDEISSRSLAAAAASFVAIGTSLNLVAIAAKVFASMSASELAKAGVAIAAFVFGVTKLTTAVKGSIKGALSFALVAGAVGTGLSLLVPAILILSKMKVSGLVKAAASLVAFIVLITRAASLAGKDKISVVQFVGISAAVAILVPAIIALAKLPFTGALKAASGIALIVAAIGLSARTVSKEKISIITFLAISAAINILAPAIVLLSQIPFAGALKAAGMLGTVIFMLVTAVDKINGKGAKGAFGNSATFLALSLAIRLMASSLIALSEVPFENILKSVAGLTLCMVAISKASEIASKANKKALLMVAIVVILAEAVRTMSTIKPSFAIKNMAMLSGLLVVVASTASVMSKIPFSSAIAALGKFAVFLAGISVISAALGALASKWSSFEKYLKKGAEIGKLLGEFIGGFIGNLVGSFLGGLSSGLVILGKNLSAFMESLKPFLKGVESIKPETTKAVKNLAQAILYLTAADLINALNSTPFNIFSGGGMVSFAKDLGLFMDELKKLGSKAEEIPNVGALDKISKTIASLGKAAMNIPSVGGIKGLISGVKDLGLFGKQLGTFVNTLADMKADNFEMGKTDVKSISRIAKAVRVLGEAANNMPETTMSVKGVIFGVKDISAFAKQLAEFAPNFSEFMGSITSKDSNINAKSLQKATLMGKAVASLAKAANEVPEELDPDSIRAKIKGVKSLPAFAEGMVSIGEKMPDIIKASSGMDKATAARITRMAKVIKAMAKAANEIHEMNGGGRRTVGTEFQKTMDDLSKFTDGMSGYVKGFKKFAKKAAGIDESKLKAADMVASSIKKVSNAANEVSKIKGDATSIKDMLTKMADGLGKYAKKVNELDVSNIEDNTAALKSSIKSTTKALSGAKKSAKSSASSAVDAYVKGLKSGAGAKNAGDAASSVRKAAVNALDKTGGFKKAGNSAVSAYVGAIKKAKGASSAGKSMANSAKSGASGVSFYGAGKDGAIGFANGLKDRDAINRLAGAGTYIGGVALKAAERKIKRGSPAKEFIAIGRDGTLGFAIGLRDYANKVYKAGSDIGTAGLKGATDSIADLDIGLTDPRITPVLDLSKVEQGANKIGSMLSSSARIDASLMNASANRQNGGNIERSIEKLSSMLQSQPDTTPKEVYNIGDVSLDVSKLEDVTTLNEFVNMLSRAKAFAV